MVELETINEDSWLVDEGAGRGGLSNTCSITSRLQSRSHRVETGGRCASSLAGIGFGRHMERRPAIVPKITYLHAFFRKPINVWRVIDAFAICRDGLCSMVVRHDEQNVRLCVLCSHDCSFEIFMPLLEELFDRGNMRQRRMQWRGEIDCTRDCGPCFARSTEAPCKMSAI